MAHLLRRLGGNQPEQAAHLLTDGVMLLFGELASGAEERSIVRD